jgi:23S rRNA (guanosine2251-2'-O)-methyltransferase
MAFLYGINPVREKMRASPHEVAEIILGDVGERAALKSLAEEAERLGIPVRYEERSVLNRLAGGEPHQGVVARAAPYVYGSFADLLSRLSGAPEDEWLLVLDSVTDPRNLGALLRTAEAVGIRHVILPQDRSASVSPLVAKASAGAVHFLNIYRVANIRQVLVNVKKKGYWVVGLDAKSKDGVYGRSYPQPLVVVLGAEGTGIRPLIQRECDFVVSLPMRGRVSSLNVSVAGGAFLYELVRQRVLRQG